MKKHFSLSIYLLIGVSFFAVSQTKEWKKEKDSDDIKVYTRKIEGIEFKEFKATATFNTSPDKIAKEIKNFPNSKNWTPDLEKSEVLKKKSEDNYIVRAFVDTPWPVSDRDAITEYVFNKKENGEIFISMEGREKYIPKDDDYIRILDAKGSWTLTPTDDGKTNVIYRFVANPNGSMPTWVVNMFIVDGPYKTLKALKKIVE